MISAIFRVRFFWDDINKRNSYKPFRRKLTAMGKEEEEPSLERLVKQFEDRSGNVRRESEPDRY